MGSAGNGGVTRYYQNNGDSTFTDRTIHTQLSNADTYSISAADLDKDGDLDIAITRWIFHDDEIIWFNDGTGQFTDNTSPFLSDATHQSTFTAGLVDVNNDYVTDLLMTSDFSDSKYYLSNNTANLQLVSTNAISDENGMGGAYADYDNDGDLDWFVSSIYDADGVSEANWGTSGNRLYQNDGSGNFTDVSQAAGVRHGFWGWGSCFADFNNDMHQDLYHVNGFPIGDLGIDETDFDADPARMFINQGDGTFIEMGATLNVADTGQGRAILCFDNDNDGDIDILVQNNDQQSVFFENNLADGSHYLQIKLQQPGPNMDGIGAKIYVVAGGVTQMRQVMAGGNYGSTVWTTQHFGLANNTSALVHVHWDAQRRESWLIDTVDQKIVLQPKPDLIFLDSMESAP